jgi:predicted AAA+ superfamily ATPase
MLTDQELLDTLARWNRWGAAPLDAGWPRRVLRRLLPFLEGPEVLALVGPRRAGKTTVMFQILDALEQAGVDREACLHVNLEEPALASELGVDILERLYRRFRVELRPTGRVYLFLDEIQRVEGWERWVRARNESEDVKIFVTGSSATLMSREMATLLTGRHLSFRVFPLDFAEMLVFRGIEAPKGRLSASPEVHNALQSYLRWGGFPEVVLAKDDAIKEALLKQYFDDVLFKDIALRHQVRDLWTLRVLAVHLMNVTASLVSLQRLSNLFGISLELVRSYCSHLEEAFLVSFLPFYSLKTAERLRRPRKVHAVDLGLRNAVSLTASADRGRLAESAVYQQLWREAEIDTLFYWKGEGEIDLLQRRGLEVEQLVQVALEGLDDPAVRTREMTALDEGRKAFGKARRRIVTGSLPSSPLPEDVEVEPLWRFLLSGEGLA